MPPPDRPFAHTFCYACCIKQLKCCEQTLWEIYTSHTEVRSMEVMCIHSKTLNQNCFLQHRYPWKVSYWDDSEWRGANSTLTPLAFIQLGGRTHRFKFSQVEKGRKPSSYICLGSALPLHGMKQQAQSTSAYTLLSEQNSLPFLFEGSSLGGVHQACCRHVMGPEGKTQQNTSEKRCLAGDKLEVIHHWPDGDSSRAGEAEQEGFPLMEVWVHIASFWLGEHTLLGMGKRLSSISPHSTLWWWRK